MYGTNQRSVSNPLHFDAYLDQHPDPRIQFGDLDPV